MWKVVLCGLLFVVSAFVVGVMYMQKDEPLSRESLELLNRVDVVGSSQSYLLLLGMNAVKGESPIEKGKMILVQEQKKDENPGFELTYFRDKDEIELPDGNFFCSSWKQACLDYLFTAEFNIDNLLSQHAELIERSNQFYKYSDFKSLMRPGLEKPLADYVYLARVERLWILSAISEYKQGDVVAASHFLRERFAVLRLAFEQQDELLGKIIFLMKMSEVIDVLTIILSEEEGGFDLIPHLSQSEKSFEMLAAREFFAYRALLLSLDGNPEFFQVGGQMPRWVTRIFFKPNMTVNAVAPLYTRLKRLSELRHFDFAEQINQMPLIETSGFRNVQGDRLNMLATNYDSYLARVMDLDIKIHLFNHVFFYKKDLADAVNPYGGGWELKFNSDTACFGGPLKDERFLRCFRTKKLKNSFSEEVQANEQ